MAQAGMIDEMLSLRTQVKMGNYVEKCNFQIREPQSYRTIQSFNLNDIKLIDNLKQTLPSHLSEEELQLFEKIKLKYRVEDDAMGAFNKLSIPFGENPYSFLYTRKAEPAKAEGEEDEEKMVPRFASIFSETASQFLGYDCLEAEKCENLRGGALAFEGAGRFDEGMEGTPGLIINWRFHEGAGVKIYNIFKDELTGILEFKGEAEPAEKVWVPLEDSDPMQLEDHYGQKCRKQYAINFKSDLISVKCLKKNWYPSNLTKFTVELWLRPKSERGTILEIGQGVFVLGYQNFEFVLQVKSSPVALTPENKEAASKDEGEDESPSAEGADEETNKIRNNFWNHIAVVYDSSQQKKLLFYLNCVLVASSELNLPENAFKDQNLFLGKENLNAELTEFRFWASALSKSEIKNQYRNPLEDAFNKEPLVIIRPPPGGIRLPPPTNPFTTLPPPVSSFPAPSNSLPAPEAHSFSTASAKFGIPRPEEANNFSSYKEERSPVQRVGIDAQESNRYPRRSEIDDEPGFEQNPVSRVGERKEEDKYGRNSEDRPESDSYNRDISCTPKEFNEFRGRIPRPDEPTSFDNFAFQPTPSSAPVNNFNNFSDFNTAPVSQLKATGEFERFEKWENNASPTPAPQNNDFSNFSSFNQFPTQKDTKKDFGDFGNFNAFETAPSRLPASDGFGFDSFSAKLKNEEPHDPGFSNFKQEQGRSSTEPPKISENGSRSSKGSSDEKKQRRSYETDETGHGDEGENSEMHLKNLQQ